MTDIQVEFVSSILTVLYVWSKLSHSLVVLLICSSFLHLSLVNYDVSTAKNLLLLALTQEDQQKWVSRLMKKIPKKPPAPDAPHRSSPRVPVKVQSSQSLRRPSRQIPSGKPRWAPSIDMTFKFKIQLIHMAVSRFILWFHDSTPC